MQAGTQAPLIGVTGHLTETSTGAHAVAANQAYLDAVRLAGGYPVILPPLHHRQGLEETLERVDGLLFTGGRDVDPAHYGQPIFGPSVHIEPERDAFELPLAALAFERDVPVLAICRGCQVLNVALGGSLWQDLPSQRPSEIAHMQKAPRDAITHRVEVSRASYLAQLLGVTNGDAVHTNSFHHQAAREVPNVLVPVAYAPDGTIEAVEAPGRTFTIGVQWHPEHLVLEHEPHRRLFEAFVEAAAGQVTPAMAVDAPVVLR